MVFDRRLPLFLNPKHCWKSFSAIITVLLLLVSGSAAALPQTFSARYEVTYSSLTLGEARVDYRQIGSDRYRYSSHIKPLGVAALLLRSEIIEVSQGSIEDDGFRPDRYEYRRTGRNSKRADLVFDWKHMKVIDSVSGDPWKMAIPDDTLDRMVSQLQLMHDLAVHEKDLTYLIADGGHIKEYTLRIVGRERLNTPLGTYDTLKIVRVSDSDKRATTFWCAAALDYLPVRVDHREKGDNFSMTLQDLYGFPNTTAHQDRQLTALQALR